MKRVMKCIALLTMLLALFAFAAGAEERGWEQDMIDAYGEEFWANYTRAQGHFDQLTAFFRKDSAGEIVYPDFVGGLYFNDEGRFVLQVVEANAARDQELSERVMGFAAQAEGMLVAQVTYSQNEKTALMDSPMIRFEKSEGRAISFDMGGEAEVNYLLWITAGIGLLCLLSAFVWLLIRKKGKRYEYQ